MTIVLNKKAILGDEQALKYRVEKLVLLLPLKRKQQTNADLKKNKESTH